MMQECSRLFEIKVGSKIKVITRGQPVWNREAASEE